MLILHVPAKGGGGGHACIVGIGNAWMFFFLRQKPCGISLSVFGFSYSLDGFSCNVVGRRGEALLLFFFCGVGEDLYIAYSMCGKGRVVGGLSCLFRSEY